MSPYRRRSRWLVALAVLSLVVAACGAPDPDLASPAPDQPSRTGADPSGRILFVSERHVSVWNGSVSALVDEVDAASPTWSPAGDRMLFTYIDWILWNGSYYWESMTLRGLYVGVNNGNYDIYSSLGAEMGMSWEATDKTPPNVSIQPLPATSPSDFYIFFQNQDSGGSGVGYYDLQTRPQGGTWTDWVVHGSGTASPQPFHGQGGVRYEFRIRGMDWAGNLEAWPATPDAHTTIEALPPASRFLDPPAFINRPTIVRWTASDMGGSQVAGYDLQIRHSPADPWETISENSDSTATELWWQPGESIHVRVRARDSAGNLEAWPEAGEPGYLTVMVYSQSVYGTAHDSAGATLSGVQPNLLSGTLLAHVEDGFRGTYVTYTQNEGELSLQYSKPGYGSLPAKTITASDQRLDLWLPPSDNLVLDGDLETPLEDAGSPWQRTGTIPVASSTPPGECHTGESCALLGSAGAFFSTPFRIFAEGAEPEQIASTVDSAGRLHVVGILYGQIFYRQRDAQGNWLALETPVDFDFWPFHGWTLKADSAGGVHLALGIESKVFVLSRSASGVWSDAIELVYGTNQYSEYIVPAFEIDAQDGLHIVWQGNFQPRGDVCYAYQPAGGEWQAVQVLQTQASFNPLTIHLKAGATGALHLVWEEGEAGGNGPLVYMQRDPSGVWSTPLVLVEQLFNPDPLTLELDSAGRPAIAWYRVYNPNFYVSTTWLKADGTWAEIQEKVLTNDFNNAAEPTLMLDPQNRWHILFDRNRRYAIWPRNGEIEPRGWVVPENDFSSVGATAMDRDGRIHMVYFDGTASYYTTVFGGQIEGIGQPLGDGLYSSSSQLALTTENTPHLLVLGELNESSEAVYHHMTLAFAEADQRGVLAQTLTLPPEMSQPGLSFVYGLNGGDIGGASGIVARVTGPQGTQVVYQSRLNTDTWQHGWADLSAWAGQTVTLSIGIDQKQGEGFKFGVIDEISLGSGYGDGFMQPISGRKVPLGSRFRLVIPFGNQGGFGIQDVQLRVSIPVEFELLGQDLPCTYTAGTLTCEIGPLAARETRSLVLELRTTEAAVLYQSAVISYSLSTSSAELEVENNQQTANLVPVNELYLPAVGNWWVGE